MIFPAHRLGEQPGLVGLVGLLKPMDEKSCCSKGKSRFCLGWMCRITALQSYEHHLSDIFVTWELGVLFHIIPNIWKNKKNLPNHQPGDIQP